MVMLKGDGIEDILKERLAKPLDKTSKGVTTCSGPETGFFPQIPKIDEAYEDQIMMIIYESNCQDACVPLSSMPIRIEFSNKWRIQ